MNIARAIDELKEPGVWTVGLAGEAADTYDQVDLTLPTALVLGAEGTGTAAAGAGALRPAGVDPDARDCGILNVSVAAGVVLFEAVRQRNARNFSPSGDRNVRGRLACVHGTPCATNTLLSGLA